MAWLTPEQVAIVLADARSRAPAPGERFVHESGHYYAVIGIALLKDGSRPHVLYCPLPDGEPRWAQPLEDWLDRVQRGGMVRWHGEQERKEWV